MSRGSLFFACQLTDEGKMVVLFPNCYQSILDGVLLGLSCTSSCRMTLCQYYPLHWGSWPFPPSPPTCPYHILKNDVFILVSLSPILLVSSFTSSASISTVKYVKLQMENVHGMHHARSEPRGSASIIPTPNCPTLLLIAAHCASWNFKKINLLLRHYA